MHGDNQDVPSAQTVKKRKVLYLSGFDPRGASHYYSLYKEEAAKAEAVTGDHYTLSPRKRNGRIFASWTIQSDTTQCDYEFLGWDDIVRNCWPKTLFEILAHAARLYPYYVSIGAATGIRRLSRAFFMAWLYPLVFILPLLVLSLGGAILISMLAAAWVPGLGLEWLLPVPFAYMMYTKLGELLERKFGFLWAFRSFYFYVALARSEVVDMDARILLFAERLLDVLKMEEYEEVLLVGHSAGATLLPMVVHRALSIDPLLGGAAGKLALLTLGHAIPAVTLQPQAESVREAVRKCASAGIFWLDVTAPPDGACFALVDVAVNTGLQRQPGQPHYPVAISARFHKMFAPEYYKAVKRDQLLLHFQYLMAGVNRTEYNYFEITAGPLLLAQRFSTNQTNRHE